MTLQDCNPQRALWTFQQLMHTRSYQQPPRRIFQARWVFDKVAQHRGQIYYLAFAPEMDLS